MRHRRHAFGGGRLYQEIKQFNRHFYRYEPPRALEAIAADVKELEAEIVVMLAEIAGSAGGEE